MDRPREGMHRRRQTGGATASRLSVDGGAGCDCDADPDADFGTDFNSNSNSNSNFTADRTASAPLRALLAILLLGSLAVGIALVEPGFVDAVEDELEGTDLVPETEEPADPDDESDEPGESEATPAEESDSGSEGADPNDPGETTYEGGTTVASSAVETHVHDEVNDRRAAEGLAPLEWDETVASVSRAHSGDMVDRDYFAHQNPEGEQPWDRFDDVENYCGGYGENIAMTWVDRPIQSDDGVGERYTTAEELADGLVEQWMNSPPHREAILTESWDSGGVGVTITADGQVFATHNFCRR